MTSELYNDELLASRLKGGDEYAFEMLYRKYHRALYYIAFKYLRSQEMAEDAVQDVFVKLWLHRTNLNEQLSVKGLLFTSLKNYVLNLIRDNQNKVSRHAELFANVQPYHRQTEDEVILAGYAAIAQAGIKQLPPQKKRIFEMRTVNGLTNEEVAKQLGISTGTVKVQFSQASTFLRDYLEKYAGIHSVSVGFWFLFT